MTNEEAKCYIRTLLEVGGCDGFDYKQRVALNRAIKALDQQQDVHDTCIEDYPTCTECEHYDSEKHYCPRFCQVIKDTLAEAQPKTEIKNLKTEIEKPKSEMTADGDLIRLADTDKLKKYRFSFDENTTIPKSDLFVRVTDLVNMPSVKPKKGKWIDVSPISYICSCCSYGVGRWNNTSYCPNCGALMEVEDGE